MPNPYFRQTTMLNGKVVSLDEARSYREAHPDPATPEERAAAERLAESYAPRFKGQYSEWHFNNRKAI